MSEEEAAPHLPLVGEAARPAEREVLAAAPATPADHATDRLPHAPIIVVHGVGEFRAGDLISEIANQPIFSRSSDFLRETVFVRENRYTLLIQGRPGDSRPSRVHLMEVNWSDVRRAMPNLLGLLRNFVTLLMALLRIAGRGAYRSNSLSVPLRSGVLTLWLVEALLVWASLAPALSALLWQLAQGERMAAGAVVALASLYTAKLVRSVSLPLAVGGVVFAIFSAWAGWWTCFMEQGRDDFSAVAALVHTWATLAAASSVLLSSAESLIQRGRDPHEPVQTIHRLSRIACMWLPLLMLVLLQPLTVSVLLLTMDTAVRSNWGVSFARHMPFDPRDGLIASGWIAVMLAGTLLLGALQFKLLQRHGRNVTLLFGLILGGMLLGSARFLEQGPFIDCPVCQQCLRTDWVGFAGLLLLIGAAITWVLFWRSDIPVDPAGKAWYPAGAFARFWASVMLAGMPLVLAGALLWLLWRTVENAGAVVVADAAAVFLDSTKYVLLLLPLASKPFAAFLDALGDVFFYLVRQRNLNTRLDTQPRLWRALHYLVNCANDGHFIVFAHSQGTVIAAGMFSRMSRVLLRSKLRVTLVTVGCPVTTLYRNFLGARVGAEFAALCKAEPARFRWFNLYRPADYIGGAVELEGVENRDLLTPGDHVGYWCDRELLKWLKALSEDRAA